MILTLDQEGSRLKRRVCSYNWSAHARMSLNRTEGALDCVQEAETKSG